MQAIITFPPVVEAVHGHSGPPAVVKPSQAVNLGHFIKLACYAAAWTGLFVALPWNLHWAVLVVPLALLAFRAAYSWLDFACLSYRFEGGERIIWSFGVLSRNSGSLEVFRVQNVSLQQTFLERLAGVGTITLETRDATNPMLRLVGMREPEKLRASLTEYVQRARRVRGVQEAAVN
ncbi:PH domain-containing protein [Variovorax sp. LT1P1]|uniref:PH domain-containing protein n=1 Tax=Variovorax sp. LT1P1 TaxID=3443730 RepID=UPI003F447B85